ncbi:MAG TPA: outer membrane protein assembly factor BamE [Burkholderiaceae bacterium]|nr:outer membrane protein assembly factor BamE [Burkholderiaceae bacterium]
MGKHTYMVDLDREGRAQRWTQVLTDASFHELRPGMSRQEVLYRLGRPSHEMHIPRRQERIWSYRYESPFCQWFQVNLDTRTGRVTETGYNVDPLCDADDRNDR